MNLLLKSITFKNFKALRDATLPLSPFTLIVGPNGSGKSTVLDSLREFQRVAINAVNQNNSRQKISQPLASIHGSQKNGDTRCSFEYMSPNDGASTFTLRSVGPDWNYENEGLSTQNLQDANKLRVFEFDPKKMAGPDVLMPHQKLQPDGSGLAGTLDALRDEDEERFDELNIQLNQWLPEYDRILFETPSQGNRSLALRTTEGHHKMPASVLSHGTLVALALLTMVYIQNPPTLIGLEEPDRGIHPRLLRKLKDAIYRLAYPSESDGGRPPIQVIATTHSPYFVDQFKDHPEEIVVANKNGLDVSFERLSDKPHLQEIIQDSSLGEVWYSGILGGVPTPS